jgi:Zn-dependent protease
MGWQDRQYSASSYDNGGWRGAVRWISTGSVWLGQWFGINVRVHASLIILIVLGMLFSGLPGGLGIGNALTSSLVLFGIVLLHEFGHCFAARKVGGDADEILLWPLGGLAFVHTPPRPWPTFIGVAGGPLVNIVICAITGAGLLALAGGQMSLPWNPLLPFDGAVFNDRSFQVIYGSTLGYYLWWIYTTSWMLFFFNMLPIFPLDGGRIFQTILWPFIGYYRSMSFSCTVGMGAAVLMCLVGLATNWFLIFLGISGFMTCYQTKMTLRESADAAWEESRFADGGWRGWNLPQRPNVKRRQKPKDDQFSVRDLNPIEWFARRRRKRQFERLIKEDKERVVKDDRERFERLMSDD